MHYATAVTRHRYNLPPSIDVYDCKTNRGGLLPTAYEADLGSRQGRNGVSRQASSSLFPDKSLSASLAQPRAPSSTVHLILVIKGLRLRL